MLYLSIALVKVAGRKSSVANFRIDDDSLRPLLVKKVAQLRNFRNLSLCNYVLSHPLPPYYFAEHLNVPHDYSTYQPLSPLLTLLQLSIFPLLHSRWISCFLSHYLPPLITYRL